MARPSIIIEDPEIVERIATHIEKGSKPEDAAELEGMSKRTFYNYMNEGRNAKRKDSLFLQFLQRIKKAKKFAKAFYIEKILQAAQGDKDLKLKPQWQAAAWWLERNFPDDYARKDRQVHEGKIKQEHSGKIELISLERKERLRRIEEKFNDNNSSQNASRSSETTETDSIRETIN